MTAFIVIAAIIAYIAIGCLVNIAAVKCGVEYPRDNFTDFVIGIMFLWPIMAPIAVIASLLLWFEQYLLNMIESRKK